MPACDADKVLHSLRVLVTRPQEQAKALCKRIDALGGTAISVPTMAIEALEELEYPNTPDYDLLIFISANAARFGLPHLGLAPHQDIACVGKQTARAIESLGHSVDVVPEHDFSSQGLLALKRFDSLTDQRVLIVRGKGGKESLKTQLERRGAKVDYFECYQRVLPDIDDQALRDLVANKGLDIVTSSSNQNLMNLIHFCPDIHQLPLISISPLMTEQAKTLGFSHITQAHNASDDAVIDALCAFAKN